jgi:hypothetical protein
MIIQIILGSQIIESPEGLVIILGQFGLNGDLRTPEVTYLKAIATATSNQDVLGLQVQVHQLLLE